MATGAMAQKKKTLNDLRAKIDEIDDALHDLLIRRADVSRAIAKVKQSGADGKGTLAPAMYPAREAQILRRLLARHRGDPPASVIVRIWREIIAASLQAQSAFHLHVYGGKNAAAFFDLAHAYFGSLTPIHEHVRALIVVQACADEPNTIGIVPLPESEESNPAWWTQLTAAGQVGPRVVAKLPFISNGEDNPVSAYAIGGVEQEPSGDDTTLLRLETAGDLSRARLQDLLRQAGFEANLISALRGEKSGPGIVLVAVDGFVGGSDERLDALRAQGGSSVLCVDPVGGFANPVVLPAGKDEQ